MESPSEVEPTRSPWLATRAFGPFADAFGAEIAKLPPLAARNIARLVEKFQGKTSPADQGELSSRLFKQVMDEAAWAEEDIVTEYLSGVLASSSKEPISDRGVAITALIRRLSSAELRAHYLRYAELLRLHLPVEICDLRLQSNVASLHRELNLDEFFDAMGYSAPDWEQRRRILDHVILGLAREQLVDP